MKKYKIVEKISSQDKCRNCKSQVIDAEKKTPIYSQNLSQEIRNIVRDAAAGYDVRTTLSRMTYEDLLQDHFMIIALIRHGLPFSFFEGVRASAPLQEEDWAEVLGVSLKTLQRYEKQQKTFKPLQSEKIIAMAEVMMHGMEVFEDMDRFTHWLYTPSFALGQMKPVDLLRDSYGKEMVMTELTHIDQGIFV